MLTKAQNIAIENVSNYAFGKKNKYQEQIIVTRPRIQTV